MSSVYAFVSTPVDAATLNDNNGNHCRLGEYRRSPIQLREFDYASSYDPSIQFLKPNRKYLRMDSYSSGAGSIGRGYAFVVIKRSTLQNARIKVRWNVYHSYPDSRDLDLATVYVFNACFDRSNMVSYFKPNQNKEPIFDHTNVKALQYPFQHKVGWNGWFESTSSPLDLSSWTYGSVRKQKYVTVLIRLADNWIQDTVMVDVDYLQILDASNKVLFDFQFSGSITMELTGTPNDYGILHERLR